MEKQMETPLKQRDWAENPRTPTGRPGEKENWNSLAWATTTTGCQPEGMSVFSGSDQCEYSNQNEMFVKYFFQFCCNYIIFNIVTIISKLTSFRTIRSRPNGKLLCFNEISPCVRFQAEDFFTSTPYSIGNVLDRFRRSIFRCFQYEGVL